MNKIPPNFDTLFAATIVALQLFKGLTAWPLYRPFGVKGLRHFGGGYYDWCQNVIEEVSHFLHVAKWASQFSAGASFSGYLKVGWWGERLCFSMLCFPASCCVTVLFSDTEMSKWNSENINKFLDICERYKFLWTTRLGLYLNTGINFSHVLYSSVTLLCIKLYL